MRDAVVIRQAWLRGACWLAVAAVNHLTAQSWTPRRIVAITEYVPLGAKARIFGDVVIKCLLAGDGSVIRADVVSGHPLLAAQAKENALLWKFQCSDPGQKGNHEVDLTYRYRLEDSVNRLPSRTQFAVDLPSLITITAPSEVVQP